MACFVICCHSHLWLPPLFMLDSPTFDCILFFCVEFNSHFFFFNQDSNLWLKAVTLKIVVPHSFTKLTHSLTHSLMNLKVDDVVLCPSLLVFGCVLACMGVFLCAQWLLCSASLFALVRLYGLFIINERFSAMLLLCIYS